MKSIAILNRKKPKSKFVKRPLASTLVLPCCSLSRKVTLATYFVMLSMFSRVKQLTDLVVCWMHRSGYSELTIELSGPAKDGLSYRMTLKSREKSK